MSKIEADSLKFISASKLKEFGLFSVSQDIVQKSATLTWSTLQHGVRKPNGTILLTLSYNNGVPSNLKLKYRITSTNEDREYYVRIVKVTPNFGGIRLFFICPNTECGFRCTKLYLAHSYFLCRKCHELTYESNNRSAKYRRFDRLLNLMPGLTDSPSSIDKLIAKVERYPNYKGQPTRANVKLQQIVKNIPSRAKVEEILQL